MPDPLDGLNRAQLAAVTHSEGPLLVVAGAGTGQTATFHAFCSLLLQDEALEAGLDPFFSTVTPADRLALLLEHIDELELRHHQIRGNPAPLLASFVSRIDRLKDEMVGVEECRRWAAGLPEDDDATR